MEPLSPITMPIRMGAGVIILLLSIIVVGVLSYLQHESGDSQSR